MPAIQGLSDGSRVIYVGTFSKMLFPAMRLGFMVLPPDLASRIKPALSVTGQFAPLVLQAALADFIREGHFFRHLNRKRRLYEHRRALFLGLFAEHLSDWLEPIDGRTGIQIAAVCKGPVDDHAIVRRAADDGINLAPLSLYFNGAPALRGLLMGYAGVDETAMRRAFPKLRQIIGALAS
jgi:GntR family transcriptional regulator/MocR family aminotransferase